MVIGNTKKLGDTFVFYMIQRAAIISLSFRAHASNFKVIPRRLNTEDWEGNSQPAGRLALFCQTDAASWKACAIG